MSLREWLIVIGVIVIIGVIIDGYRRMRLARKRASELTFGIEEVKGYDESFSSELPNGGARPTSAQDELPETEAVESDAPKRVRREDRSNRFDRIEPDFDSMDFGSAIEPGLDLSEPLASGRAGNVETGFEQPAAPSVDDQPQPMDEIKPLQHKIRDGADSVAAMAEPAAPETRAKQRPVRKVEKDKEKLSDRPAIEEVIVINVLAKNNELFDGTRLLQSVLTAGMRFGDRSIFHRYSSKDGSGQIQFSLANGVKPGTFDIEQMEATETTILSLFLCLPGPEAPQKAFAQMEETAKQLALDLGGELKDENMSVMTQQTLEHCRQRIRDYERKQLAIKLSH
ncbi:cell division protein ZipA [Endozoicomonas gorgoniicola]|uniref:Cell division protein ZipA n=1 Tax=Endozoicomonas gorgoniicola TaxID=1234144 RepID=A0ABT3MXS2_9GAMM|nr:cell division protein ZipA [Endozoicomonas gorgoniicola]MCW7554155.1 cell division protein ZipA [Endozoicomonas gorgoniicola]